MTTLCFPVGRPPHMRRICVPLLLLMEPIHKPHPDPGPLVTGPEDIERAVNDLRVLATVDHVAQHAHGELRHALEAFARERGAAIGAELAERHDIHVVQRDVAAADAA